MERGKIFAEEAYAQGKMLDHSSWQKGNERLRDNITSSDIDATFDNAGAVIFGELSSQFAEWKYLDRGQRLLYENCIKNGGPHCAVLLKHSIRPADKRPIDTRYHVESFQLLLWDYGIVCCRVISGNLDWQRFVLRWINDPKGPLFLRRQYLGLSTEDFAPSPPPNSLDQIIREATA